VFIGFGPVARGVQTLINLGAMLVLCGVQAHFSLGHAGLTLADAGVFVGLAFVTFQQSRMVRKGVQITHQAISVRSHWFERSVPLADVATVVIPHSIKPLHVLASDGGYGSAGLSLAFVDPRRDRVAREAARDRAIELLGDSGVLLTSEPLTWATGAYRDSDQMTTRVIGWTAADTAWAVPVFLVWLAVVLL